MKDALVRLTVEFARETDGHWIADVAEIPGVTAYGATQREAFDKVRNLAVEVVADRLRNGEHLLTGRKTKAKSPALTPFHLEIVPGRRALAR